MNTKKLFSINDLSIYFNILGYMLPQTNQNSNQFGNQRNPGNQFGNQGNQFGNQGNPFGNQGSTQDQVYVKFCHTY